MIIRRGLCYAYGAGKQAVALIKTKGRERAYAPFFAAQLPQKAAGILRELYHHFAAGRLRHVQRGHPVSNDEIESYARETTQLIASAITRQCAAAEQEVWYSESLNTFLSEYITNVHNATSDSQIALQRAAMRNTLYSMMYNNQAFQAVYYVGNDLSTVSCQRGTFAAGYDVLAAIDYQAELESVLDLDGQVIWESLDDHFVVMKKLVYDINTLSAIGASAW